MKIVDKAGPYRVVENPSGDYQVERRDGAGWRAVGLWNSDEGNARLKMGRLAGHRDTETPLSEWQRYYGELDTSSSVSRQHYIDTGRYLTNAETADIEEA